MRHNLLRQRERGRHHTTTTRTTKFILFQRRTGTQKKLGEERIANSVKELLFLRKKRDKDNKGKKKVSQRKNKIAIREEEKTLIYTFHQVEKRNTVSGKRRVETQKNLGGGVKYIEKDLAERKALLELIRKV